MALREISTPSSTVLLGRIRMPFHGGGIRWVPARECGNGEISAKGPGRILKISSIHLSKGKAGLDRVSFLSLLFLGNSKIGLTYRTVFCWDFPEFSGFFRVNFLKSRTQGLFWSL